jgi:hypothetical protein
MKNILFLSLFLLITCQSCTTEEIPTSNAEPKKHLITISNDNKPFEYWLDSAHYSTTTPVSIYVPEHTQITITAVVTVVNNTPIIPNIKVHQDNKLVQIRQITSGFFWYQIP